MSHVTTGPFVPAPFPLARIWRRIGRAIGGTKDPRATALRRAQRERMSPHLMRDMGLIDTHDPGAHLALMPPGRLHHPYY